MGAAASPRPLSPPATRRISRSTRRTAPPGSTLAYGSKPDRVAALLVSASVLELRVGHEALVPLRNAWTIVSGEGTTIPPELRATVHDRLIAALDRAGMHDEADSL